MTKQHPSKTLAELRSRRWYGANDMRGFSHRQRSQQMGLRREDVLTKPVVAIINTWSDLSPCHAHLRERAESVKKGVLMAGGLPFELPAMSLGEVMVKPTTMLYRNLLAMEVEELLRSHPVDGVVLLAGCDKTTPGTVMGAISMGLPTIYCAAGPMLNDRHVKAGVTRSIGAGTHTRMFWDELQAGRVTPQEWVQLESKMTRSPGTCNTMGTASTMTALVEALGLALPGSTSIPAMDSAHTRMVTTSASTNAVMVLAVPMVLQVPGLRVIFDSSCTHSCGVTRPACNSSQNMRVWVPAPMLRVTPAFTCRSFSIGPAAQ